MKCARQHYFVECPLNDSEYYRLGIKCKYNVMIKDPLPSQIPYIPHSSRLVDPRAVFNLFQITSFMELYEFLYHALSENQI